MGFGYAVVTPSATSVAQVSAGAVWGYPQRSLTDMQNLVTAIQSNNPSLLSQLSDVLYAPAPFFAGQVSATQVAAFLNNLVLNYGLAGPVAAAISASPYGLWSTNFVSQVIPYLSDTTIAQVLMSGQMDANHAQSILYYLVQNYYYNKWIYTITANAPSSITFSTNAMLSTNVLIAQNITIASGVTVTCGTTACFFVAQSFNNNGTVIAYGGAGGQPATSTVGNYGGTGGGGIVVAAVTAVLGTINVNGYNGGAGATAPLTGSGGTGAAGVFYIVAGVTVPTGGTGGYSTNGYLGVAGINGAGGGGSYVGSYGGAGGNGTVYAFSSPNAMVTYMLQGIGDWWLINVAGRAPSSITSLPYVYGSGGGAGGVYASYCAGGGGGGGGGEAVVYGYSIVSGTINAFGGNGGGTYHNGAYSVGGGGGGGGGLVFIFYGASSGNITANVAGGTGNAGAESGVAGLAGASGTAYIAAVTVNG